MSNQIFLQADPQKLGIITGDSAIKVFGGAGLSNVHLGEIWAIADSDNNGFLTRKGVAVALRLIGWAQKGEQPTLALLSKRTLHISYSIHAQTALSRPYTTR